ncbi:hypothetical protein AURDEDRAFT_168022 [Auricularia subglabra TFB-10046 SS5]|nr:hypothetical protein AURDEDRAFT_168022 [Auricularia subglabra TFB-10046 SS5]
MPERPAVSTRRFDSRTASCSLVIITGALVLGKLVSPDRPGESKHLPSSFLVADMSRLPITLPVEIDNMWLDYLDQPSLLRVAAASRRFRDLVTKHKEFYICARLLSVREDARAFVRRVARARQRRVQLSIQIYLPYVLSRRSRSTLETKISSELERSMHLVRSLSVLLATALAPEFLLYPAPALRSFQYHIDTSDEGILDPYSPCESEDSSDSGLGNSADEYNGITPDLFAGNAPRLTSLDLSGVLLPVARVAAFEKVLDVRLDKAWSTTVDGMDFALMFPVTRQMRLTEIGGLIERPRLSTAFKKRTFPPSLTHLYLDETIYVVDRLLYIYDVSTVPHLHVTDAHDWSPFLSHIDGPMHLRVTLHPRDAASSEDRQLVLHVTLSSEAGPLRTVTFYSSLEHTAIFHELGAACDTICVINLPHALLHTLVTADSLPSLRHLRICVSVPVHKDFWAWNRMIMRQTPSWARALETLELWTDGPDATVNSHGLSEFAHALAARCPTLGRVLRLSLDGVTVTGGRHNDEFFSEGPSAPVS